jgi:hypothetical protein
LSVFGSEVKSKSDKKMFKKIFLKFCKWGIKKCGDEFMLQNLITDINEHTELRFNEIQKCFELHFPAQNYFFQLFINSAVDVFMKNGGENSLSMTFKSKDSFDVYDVIIQKVGGRTTQETINMLRYQLRDLGHKPIA